jgi:hypothetical protein
MLNPVMSRSACAGLARLMRLLAVAVAALAAMNTRLPAQTLPAIRFADLPHVAIISPLFYWDGQADAVHSVSATCPAGRPIAGGLSIEKGNASLRLRESYPDGSSWVIRAVNRRAGAPEPLQVRAYAVCLLPVARGGSVQIVQYPRVLQLSQRFLLPPGDVTTAERQACTEGSLVISGGLGLDPEFQGRSFVRMELSYPDKWGWNVRAINDGKPEQSPAEVRVYAICLGTGDGSDARSRRGVSFAQATVTVKPGGALRQTVPCTEGDAQAISGGARLVRGKDAAIEIQESFPDGPGSWTVAVTNRAAAGTGNATVRLYAVCIGP